MTPEQIMMLAFEDELEKIALSNKLVRRALDKAGRKAIRLGTEGALLRGGQRAADPAYIRRKRQQHRFATQLYDKPWPGAASIYGDLRVDRDTFGGAASAKETQAVEAAMRRSRQRVRRSLGKASSPSGKRRGGYEKYRVLPLGGEG